MLSWNRPVRHGPDRILMCLDRAMLTADADEKLLLTAFRDQFLECTDASRRNKDSRTLAIPEKTYFALKENGFWIYLNGELREVQGEAATELPVGHDGQPPRRAEFVLRCLVPRKDRKVVIDQLHEEYKEMLDRFDKRTADGWYRIQVALSLAPMAKSSFRHVVVLKVLAWIGQHVGRFLSQ